MGKRAEISTSTAVAAAVDYGHGFGEAASLVIVQKVVIILLAGDVGRSMPRYGHFIELPVPWNAGGTRTIIALSDKHSCACKSQVDEGGRG